MFTAELLHHCELFPVPAGGCSLHYQFRPCLSYVSFFVSILNQNPQPEIEIIMLDTELTMVYHYILMTVSRESSFQVWTLGTGRWLINRSEGEILVMFQVDQRVTWYFFKKASLDILDKKVEETRREMLKADNGINCKAGHSKANWHQNRWEISYDLKQSCQ